MSARLAAAAALLAAATAACSEPPAPKESGFERIVSLAPSWTETIFELGLAARVVGISDYCPPPPPGCGAERVGGLVNPNVERLLALEPDLVLTVQDAEDRALAALRRRGVRVLARDPQSLEEMLAGIEEVGAMLGAEARARELSASLRERLDALAGSIEVAADREGGAPRRPRVYVEVDYPNCWTVGRRTFVHDALVRAGAENVFGDLDDGYVQVNKEDLVARAPDWILVLHPCTEPLSHRPEIARLEAFRSGRVIADLERDLLLRSGPRLVLGIEELARRLAAR